MFLGKLILSVGRCESHKPHMPSRQLSSARFRGGRRHCRTKALLNSSTDDDAEPDWEKEMSIFRKRKNRPSALETLRKISEKVDVGKVLYSQDSIAIVEGLNNDADPGTELQFASGARGVLLWRRSDNIVFALLLGGADLVAQGDRVECCVQGILQIIDDEEGPKTKRDYRLFQVPVGNSLKGRVIDYLCRPLDTSSGASVSSGSFDERDSDDRVTTAKSVPVRTEATLPLVNKQPDMENRQQIHESLFTGVRAIDILTPLGRGQTLLITGPKGSGKTQLCLDVIAGQADRGVHCVYAAVGSTQEQLERTINRLRDIGAMEYTTVVTATADKPLGEQYAAMLTACCIAEESRDNGGHSLVVFNDSGVAVKMWEHITAAMADLGTVALQVSAEDVKDVLGDGDEDEDVPAVRQDLVEYEGMLVTAAAAQRRRFLSSLIQRAAKMHGRHRGGSMTMLLVVPGFPATGRSQTVVQKVQAYTHLTKEQKAKLLAVLEKESGGGSAPRPLGPNEVRTEVIEELMSISDGQAVLQSTRDIVTGGAIVDPELSFSRIGARALAPALEALAPQVRLDLAQAADALRFAAGGTMDKAAKQAAKRAAILTAAMPQPRGSTISLEDQTLQLLALQNGMLDDIDPADVQKHLKNITAVIKGAAPEAMKEIRTTRVLSEETKIQLLETLKSLYRMSRK